MIKIYNRKTQEYEIEKVAGGKLLDALYTTRAGGIGLELLVKRKFYSWLTGFFCDRNISKHSIEGFAKSFSINMDECECAMKDFESFNAFFSRKLKPGSRPFDSTPELLLSPGDGRLQAWMHIDSNKLIQVKGITYHLEELLQDDELAGEYDGGTYLILRLCPVDYHRFHFFDSGSCSSSRRIKGEYYSVNPAALNRIPELFCRNKREYSIFKSRHFEDVIYMEVGATSVGSIVQTYTPDTGVERGQEKGYFKFGGSTILLFFKKNSVSIDPDILEQTAKGFETKVMAGETIGRKKA